LTRHFAGDGFDHKKQAAAPPPNWVVNMFSRLQRALGWQFRKPATTHSAPTPLAQSPAETGTCESQAGHASIPAYIRVLRMSESLGDNCEFGFFQRYENFEPSSLFRWAVTPIDRLIAFLQAPVEIFLDADLQCVESDLVYDKGSGFYFHSELIRNDERGRELVSDPIGFSTIYAREKQKIDYLKAKFLQRLAGAPCLYVIKANAGIKDEDLHTLARELRKHNCSHLLLYVTEAAEFALVEKGDGLFEGAIGRLAPYHAANDIDLEGWRRLFGALANQTEIASLIDGSAV
jgi:hypothetical protein